MDHNRFWHTTGKCVGSSSGYPLYQYNMFELEDNRFYAFADDSTLLAVVRRPADKPAVAASLNRDLARIQEWCNRWCMILNPNKSKALVVSRSRTVNPPLGDLVLSGVSICARGTAQLRGTAHEGGGCDQSIGSTVSDAIVRSRLWPTATRISPFGYFSNYSK